MRLFPDVASRVEDPHLRRAVEIAERARGMTAPNPLVGAVVVRDDEVVGEGYHPRAGEPHAEVFALAHAGASSHGATLYVTMEPCNHHGRTPPCTDAILAAGISHAVIGMPDPTDAAHGGAQRLHDAGVHVTFAADRAPFEELNAGWLTRQWRRRPRVLVKVGLSLDGRVGFALGERADITGASGRRITSLARSQCDAVLVGAATVAADDPALTVRDERDTPTERQPLRVVLCRETLPRIDARVLTDDKAATLLLVPEALVEQATRLPGDHVVAEAYDVEAGLTGALEALGRRGINDVLIEAGPRLFSGLASEDLIDRLVTVTAGGLIGPAGPSFFAGPSSRREDALEYAFAPANSAVVGDVVVSVWERRSSLLPSSSRL